MGSTIELNDTLKLKRGEGFPREIIQGGQYSFSLPGIRLFHPKPVRVFLVEEVAGLWNYIGHAMILEQTIDAEREETRGRFEVTLLYPPEYAAQVNEFEAPKGKAYRPTST